MRRNILLLALTLPTKLLWAQAVSPSAGASATRSVTVVSTISASAVEPRAPSRPVPSVSALEKAVADTERQRFAAQVTKNYAVLDKVLANDLIYTHSTGNTDTKQGYIQSIRDGKLTYDAIDVTEEKIRLYGNTAVINGVCVVKATNNGETINTRLRYTDVYVRRGNQWQLVTWQAIRIGL